MLDFPSTSGDDEMENGVSKSTCLGPTIKHFMKETRLYRRSERNLVRKGHNIRAEISVMAKLP